MWKFTQSLPCPQPAARLPVPAAVAAPTPGVPPAAPTPAATAAPRYAVKFTRCNATTRRALEREVKIMSQLITKVAPLETWKIYNFDGSLFFLWEPYMSP